MKQKNVYNPRPSVVEPVSLCYRCAVSGLVCGLCGLVLASVLAFTVLVCGCSAPVAEKPAAQWTPRPDYGYDPLKAAQESRQEFWRNYWADPVKVQVVDRYGRSR